MRDGTRSSSTCQTSPGAPMAPTTLRHSGCRSMPTAASAASISATVCTRRRSYLPSSSCSSPSLHLQRLLQCPWRLRGHLEQSHLNTTHNSSYCRSCSNSNRNILSRLPQHLTLKRTTPDLPVRANG